MVSYIDKKSQIYTTFSQPYWKKLEDEHFTAWLSQRFSTKDEILKTQKGNNMATLEEFRIRLEEIESILQDMRDMVPTGNRIVDGSAGLVIFNLKGLRRDLRNQIDMLVEEEEYEDE